MIFFIKGINLQKEFTLVIFTKNLTKLFEHPHICDIGLTGRKWPKLCK